MKFVIVLILVCCTLADKLKFSALVFRHGDRSPVEYWPSDPYQSTAWPQGAGQLSLIGELQHLDNGRYFRQRYTNISQSTYLGLNYNYTRSQVYVRSTDTDRTLMSAESFLSGLFGPSDNNTVPPAAASPLNVWQPIPVHTTEGKTEPMLAGQPLKQCPKFKDSFQQTVKDDPAFQTFMSDNQALIVEIYNITQYQTTNDLIQQFHDITFMYDTLFCEQAHNMTPPQRYIDFQLMEKTKKFSDAFWTIPFKAMTDEEKSLSVGVFVKELRERMERSINKSSELKLAMYSAHDTTLAHILNGYAVFDYKIPPYASVLMFELWDNDEIHYVTLSRKDKNITIEYELPGCGKKCPVDVFFDLSRGYEMSPEEFYSECAEPSKNFQLPWVLGIVLGVILILSYITFSVLYQKSYNRGFYAERKPILG